MKENKYRKYRSCEVFSDSQLEAIKRDGQLHHYTRHSSALRCLEGDALIVKLVDALFRRKYEDAELADRREADFEKARKYESLLDALTILKEEVG